MTESLAHQLIMKKIINIPSLLERELVKGDADLNYKGDGARLASVEVKSTAAQGFSRFTKGDVASDFLIWIHFGNYFLDSKVSEIEVFWVKKAGKIIKEPCYMTLKKFKDLCGKNMKAVKVKI